MPTSFGSMHDQTRPLRLLEEPALPPAPNPIAATLAWMLLLLLPPILAVVLL